MRTKELLHRLMGGEKRLESCLPSAEKGKFSVSLGQVKGLDFRAHSSVIAAHRRFLDQCRVFNPVNHIRGIMATREVGQKVTLSYKDLKTDPGGWVSSKDYQPQRFDIASLLVKRDGEMLSKSLPGWWTGTGWEGQRLRRGDEVVYWKHKGEKETQ